MVSDWISPPLTTLWIVIVLKFVYHVLKKPWGVTAGYRKAIENNEKRRNERFEEFRRKTETFDEQILSQRKHILQMDLLQLIEALQKDQFNAVNALEAYVWKAMQIQTRINCCIDVIQEAFQIAEEVDQKYSGKSTKPPLYGVPFSVKGNFYLNGYDCTIGLAKFLNQPRTEECSLVTHLKNLGAVPFVVTNVPQALLSYVCSNSVYGTTLNPHDPARSPGGSSGGEAALVAAGGTPFGTGSDLAGSLRIPAHFCGIVSLKPTQGRLVVTGSHGGIPGRGRLALGFGFFTKTVAEQYPLLQNVMGTEEYCQLVPQSSPSPFQTNKVHEFSKKKMKIGYFEDDGFCSPVPAMRRCVSETVERLKMDGHELIAFSVPKPDHMINILFKAVMPDAGSYCRSLYENDVVDEYMKQFVMLLKIPRFVRWIGARLIRPFSPQFAAICDAYVSDIDDLRYTQEQIDDYIKQFTDYWKNLGIDAVVCPSFIVPAVPHDIPSKLSAAMPATGLFNLLDFPSGIVPTGKVSREDDQALMDESTFRVGYNLVRRVMRDGAKASSGLPTSVQVVTLPYEEEKCLSLMETIHKLWNL